MGRYQITVDGVGCHHNHKADRLDRRTRGRGERRFRCGAEGQAVLPRGRALRDARQERALLARARTSRYDNPGRRADEIGKQHRLLAPPAQLSRTSAPPKGINSIGANLHGQSKTRTCSRPRFDREAQHRPRSPPTRQAAPSPSATRRASASSSPSVRSFCLLKAGAVSARQGRRPHRRLDHLHLGDGARSDALSATLANIRGSATESITIEFTTDGTGALTNGSYITFEMPAVSDGGEAAVGAVNRGATFCSWTGRRRETPASTSSRAAPRDQPDRGSHLHPRRPLAARRAAAESRGVSPSRRASSGAPSARSRCTSSQVHRRRTGHDRRALARSARDRLVGLQGARFVAEYRLVQGEPTSYDRARLPAHDLAVRARSPTTLSIARRTPARRTRKRSRAPSSRIRRAPATRGGTVHPEQHRPRDLAHAAAAASRSGFKTIRRDRMAQQRYFPP
jgi:hypothetical protein